MPGIEDFLSKIKDEGVEKAKEDFRTLFNEAKGDAEGFVRELAKDLEGWLVLLAMGEMKKNEVELLVRSRKRELEQKLNTLEIKTKARVEKIVMGLVDIVLDTLLKKF